MDYLNHGEIEEIRDEKQKFEVNVAKALYDLFDCPRYKGPIQELVCMLIEHILKSDPDELNRWLPLQARSLLIFKKGIVKPASAFGLKMSLFDAKSWKLEYCSDFIRLFGEFNEKWRTSELSGGHFGGQDNLRRFPTFHKFDEEKKGWSKVTGHRHRKEIDKAHQVRRGAPYLDLPEDLTRGVERYTFGDHSVIADIDTTFGLKQEGGDVSGTTTDSIYALKWAASVVGRVGEEILKAIQLLPLATMVPLGHHAILECAYPLSRWYYMDYHIGYYTTLTPIVREKKDQAPTGRFKRAQEEIKAVLAPFDPCVKVKRQGRAWMGSAHVLVWRKPEGKRKAEGLLMVDPDEIAGFKNMTKVLNAYGFCVNGGLRDCNQAMKMMDIFWTKQKPVVKEEEVVGLTELERAFKKFGLR